MKLKILFIKLKIVYRLAKFTSRLAMLFCDKHHELYHKYERKFKEE